MPIFLGQLIPDLEKQKTGKDSMESCPPMCVKLVPEEKSEYEQKILRVRLVLLSASAPNCEKMLGPGYYPPSLRLRINLLLYENEVDKNFRKKPTAN